MAVRNDFAAGEVLAAADLNDTFASKLPYSYGTATPSTTDSGFLWYDSNSTPAAPKFWDGAAFQALTSGKILQVVRATDGTRRATTSTTFVDITGMSVTITPQKSDSALIIIASFSHQQASGTTQTQGRLSITDSSNNAISGAEQAYSGINNLNSFHFNDVSLFGYATPATTSAVTYKLRARTENAASELSLLNDLKTGQMYALEIAA